MSHSHYSPRLRVRIAQWLAMHLPDEVVYWCAVRVVSYANRMLAHEIGALTTIDALEAWEAKHE